MRTRWGDKPPKQSEPRAADAGKWILGGLAGTVATLLATRLMSRNTTDEVQQPSVESDEGGGDEKSQRELSAEATDKIRDAGKWLVGAFAAVGAALIAGSQLSSIGKLDVCGHFTLSCTRLWIALFGAALGLAG